MQTTQKMKGFSVRVKVEGKNADKYTRLQKKLGFTVRNQVVYHLLAKAFAESEEA
jgi:hypothetical protein